eukprot:1090563-Rhodomonas_salina.6
MALRTPYAMSGTTIAHAYVARSRCCSSSMALSTPYAMSGTDFAYQDCACAISIGGVRVSLKTRGLLFHQSLGPKESSLTFAHGACIEAQHRVSFRVDG